MADKKISQLTALSAANLAPSTDVLAIVDTSATETKKILAQDLVNGVLNVASAVGIGTASPGSVGVSGYTRLVLGAGSGATDGLTIVPSGTGGVQFTDAANVKKGYLQWDSSTGALALGTGGTTKATLDSSGNLLVGQTSWSFSNNGTQIAASGRIFNTSSTDYNMELAGGQSGRVRFYTSSGGSGTTVGSITVDTTNTQYNTSSDRRLKQNIVPAAEAGAVIDGIEVVEFDWKSGAHTRYGMIAQNLHKVAPEAVSVGDADDVEDFKNPWGVDYSKLVPMLVKEIQSLRSRVSALEAK